MPPKTTLGPNCPVVYLKVKLTGSKEGPFRQLTKVGCTLNGPWPRDYRPWRSHPVFRGSTCEKEEWFPLTELPNRKKGIWVFPQQARHENRRERKVVREENVIVHSMVWPFCVVKTQNYNNPIKAEMVGSIFLFFIYRMKEEEKLTNRKRIPKNDGPPPTTINPAG